MLTVLFSPLTNSVPRFAAVTSPVIVKITEASGLLDGANIIIIDANANTVVVYDQKHDPAVVGSYYTVTFDIREVLQDHVSFDLQTIGGAGAVAAPNSIFGYYVVLNGYYTDPVTGVSSNGLAAYPGPGVIYALNIALQAGQTQADLSQYVLGNSGSISFLSNSPASKWVTPGCSEYLGAIIDASSTTYYANIIKNQADGSIGVMHLLLDSIASNKRFDIGVGPANMEALNPGFIDDDTVSYSVQLASLGTNYFTDANNGTMESSVAGLSTDWVTLSTVTTHSGSFAARMDGANIYQNPILTSFYTITDHATQLQLQPDTTYVFEAWIKLEQQTGYTAPTELKILPGIVTGGFDGVSPMVLDYIDIDAGNIFNQWLPIRMRFTTGSTTASQQGFIRIVGIGSAHAFEKVYINVDDIGVKKEVLNSNAKTFVLDRQCFQSPTRVHFLNRLGAIDSYTFIGTETKKLKTEAGYAQLYRGIGAAISRPGRITQSITATETLVCTSGALTDDEMAWLEELLTSPRIFVERAGNYIPVTIKAGDYDTQNMENNTKSLTVELSLANTLALQRN